MEHLTDIEIKEIETFALSIRISIIEMLIAAGSGHTAGPLGMADIFATLYHKVLVHNPHDPHWNKRDRVILSNGHICPVLYATMAHNEYFPVEELLSLRKFKSRLQGHPHREYLSGIETSSGPLGSGLSQALGMALAERMDDPYTQKYFYCFMGDGELNEGQVWEALMHAGKEAMRNLIVVIDRNNIQIDGFVNDVMPIEPLRQKFESFHWHVIECDGHNISHIHQAFGEAKSSALPSIIIAHTIPGKGVHAFEYDYRWHGNPPGKGPENFWKKQDQAKNALNELRSLGGRLNDMTR
ncbi:MAG: transketolase [Alphaproteobacteria bacterium]|nr:transketolase [Alphaproteobacteria bacterium]